jgi:hypothetical protein
MNQKEAIDALETAAKRNEADIAGLGQKIDSNSGS